MANYDDNNFDDIFKNSDNATPDETDKGSENSEVDVKPVKLSRMATAGILIAGLFIILIIIITIHSCSLEKKVNTSPSSEGTVSVTEVVTEEVQNQGEVSSKIDENSAVSNEVAPTSNEESSMVDSGVNNETTNNSYTGTNSTVSENTLNEVVLPAFGNSLQSKGIVVSKHSYTYQGSYVYGVSISVLVGENTQTVQYFCPKKTYDALSSTDTVTVEYQQDSAGNVSINSISK